MSVALERNWNPDRLPPASLRKQGGTSALRLREYIHMLEQACKADPKSADLRTCLGMAYARNQDLGRSIATLEEAIAIDKNHFFARIRYAELFISLRSLHRAEIETRKALELAHNSWEFSMATRQLQEVQSRMRQEQAPHGLCDLVALWMLPPVCLFSVGLVYRWVGTW